MKAIISVYKSDVLEYIKENKLKREDVLIMCSNAEIMAEHHKEKFDEVVLLSAPMGVPANVPFLESVLLKKAAPPPPPKKATPAPAIGGDKPSNEEEVKEVVKPAPKKPAPKKVTPKPKTDAKK